jgi:hypothetical protein
MATEITPGVASTSPRSEISPKNTSPATGARSDLPDQDVRRAITG